MKVHFTFRHMDSSQELKDHTVDKLARLSRYEEREMTVHAIFSVEKHARNVEFTLNGTGHQFVSHESAEDMYEAIDVAVDKLDRQLNKDKEKRKHHKGLQGSTPQVIG